MPTDFTTATWSDALREFLLHLEATRAPKTRQFYSTQVGQLVLWADAQQIAFDTFGKRHLDRYLADRARAGKSQMTLHHDGVAIKAFFKWCAKNDLLERSFLADYEVRRAPRPPRYMPSDEDMQTLLTAGAGPLERREEPGRALLRAA